MVSIDSYILCEARQALFRLYWSSVLESDDLTEVCDSLKHLDAKISKKKIIFSDNFILELYKKVSKIKDSLGKYRRRNFIKNPNHLMNRIESKLIDLIKELSNAQVVKNDNKIVIYSIKNKNEIMLTVQDKLHKKGYSINEAWDLIQASGDDSFDMKTREHFGVDDLGIEIHLEAYGYMIKTIPSGVISSEFPKLKKVIRKNGFNSIDGLLLAMDAYLNKLVENHPKKFS